MTITIDQDRLLKWLTAGLLSPAAVIVLLDAVFSEYEVVDIGAVRRLFNITREDGVPNFFSSFQALAVGVVLLLITLTVRSQSGGSNSKTVVGWAVLTGLFFFIAFDDATKFHERMATVFSTLVTDASGDPDAGWLGSLHNWFPTYSWQLVMGPAFAAMGVFLVGFLMKQLPTSSLKGLVVFANRVVRRGGRAGFRRRSGYRPPRSGRRLSLDVARPNSAFFQEHRRVP